MFALLAFFIILFLLVLRDCLLLFFRIFHEEINGEANSFGMFLHRLFEAAFFQEFQLVLLGVANNIGLSLYFAMRQLRVFLAR